jgi:hypothetical protein
MSAATLDCPSCKGEGEQTIKTTTITPTGRTEGSFKMPCLVCRGAKKVTPEIIAREKRMADIWCKCPDSPDSYYVPDSPGSKHHWCCKRCRKVTQIG